MKQSTHRQWSFVFLSRETCSSSVLVSRQHLTLPVFPPCRLGLHFLDSPTDCWDVQRSWKYFKYTVVSCSRAPLGLCQWAANMQPVGAVCRLIHAIQQDRVGAAPKSACLSGPERKHHRLFNSDHQTQPRGPVKWRFGCASRQFASFYRLVIWNGHPRGNLKCWKLHGYCCGAAQSHLHLTPFCWYNHIPAGVDLRPQRSFQMQSTGRKSHHSTPNFPRVSTHMCRWVAIMKIGSWGDKEVRQEIYISWSN